MPAKWFEYPHFFAMARCTHHCFFAFGMLLAFCYVGGHQCCSVDRFAASCGGGMSQKVVDRMRYVLRHCRSFAVRRGVPKQTLKRWGRALPMISNGMCGLLTGGARTKRTAHAREFRIL